MKDGLFDDLDFVEVKPGSYPAKRTSAPGMVVEGDFWSVVRRGDQYILDYISGEIAGRARQVVISEAEAQRLAPGDNEAAVRLINAHGGS